MKQLPLDLCLEVLSALVSWRHDENNSPQKRRIVRKPRSAAGSSKKPSEGKGKRRNG